MRDEYSFTTCPPVSKAYLRAIVGKRTGIKNAEDFPNIQAKLENIQVTAKNLNTYCQLCGFVESSELPITYPHLMVSSLHLNIMTVRQFPLRLIGLVHLKNEITQYQPMAKNGQWSVDVALGGCQETDKGWEFVISTKFYEQQEVVWEEESTYLSKRKAKSSGKKKSELEKLSGDSQEWQIPGNLGRKYAPVSGDYNPIHLHPIIAKAFGFKRAIAHGMWTLSRSAAAIQEIYQPKLPQKLSANFKLPVFIPNRLWFLSQQEQGVITYQVLDKNREKPHVVGEMSNL